MPAGLNAQGSLSCSRRLVDLSIALATVLVGVSLHPVAAQDTSESGILTADGAACGIMDDGTPQKDYRERNSSPAMQGQLNDSWKNHYEPAMATMRQGRYTHGVLSDLTFVLRGWPNHHAALQAMVRYDLAGGRRYEFMPTACYLARAKRFAPTDVELYLLEGYYYWKKSDPARAKTAYESALELDPERAESHYHLGLLLFSEQDYKRSREHAWAAYAGGYPLRGLRDKLIRVGEWRDPPVPDPAVPPASQ